MNEIDLIERIRRKVPGAARAGLVVGIGDDCAVFRPRGAAADLLLTTDLVVEDVHFRADTHSAEAVGYRVLARGLSDIAAMGGTPRLTLLSLALAPWVDQAWLDGFYRGFLRLAGKTGTTLAGGDLSRAARLVCDVVVVGDVPRGAALRRGGARPADQVCVSGLLGASALGLETGRGPAWRKHLRPEPRLRLGRFLREELHATAAMDLSDGLSIDLRRLCLASGVAASLDGELPVFAGASINQALHGGEDYELLFTVRPGVQLPRRFERTPLARIGVIRKGKPGAVMFREQPLEPLGWDHLRR
jgi:thiamine-monophosphate kinase